ncbi:tRNA lysidine(34) synthetase TilS [Thermodesulfobacteriota bacterium]
MHPLEKETLRILVDRQLIVPGDGVLVGVSGGPDSMALLQVLARLAPQIPCTLTALYVNHNLRPEEAVKEEALLAAATKSLNIPFSIEPVDVERYAGEHGWSIEQAARHLRYEAFTAYAREQGCNRIAVGHTADDQAEEVLLRLIRGSGRKGLSGMDQIRDGQVIRPFLGVPKKRLLSYLEEKKISYLIDSSNLETRFLRNRIRLDLLPYLRVHFNSNIDETLRNTAAILSEEEAFLAEQAEDLFRKTVVVNEGLTPSAEIDLTTIRDASPALLRRLVESLFWALDCRPGFNHIDQVLQLVMAEAGEQAAHFSQGLRARKQEERIVFSYPQGKISVRGNLEEQQIAPFAVSIDGPGRYEIPEMGQVICCELLDQVPDKQELAEPGVDYLDSDKIDFPLLVRQLQPGDLFSPLGGPGRKKVGEFLIDQKIPQSQRATLPILVSGERICAILGVRIDQAFRVTPETRKVLQVRVESRS